MGNQNFKNFKDKGLLTVKEMKELHKQILFEYPFLSNVYESMLVADNTKPDCPIVWANDQFETMTLYPKEEILGRNCRFLQGKYTDKNLVKQIRYAVDNGLQMDVEILNYRKDGVAFWNCFLMLPVHEFLQKTGKVHYFIAIQKDVTLLKEIQHDPKKWTSIEVAMWLENKGLGQYGKFVVENNISGETLMTIEDNDFPALFNILGVLGNNDKKKIIKLINGLRSNDNQDIKKLTAKNRTKNGSISYSPPKIQSPTVITPKPFWEKTPRDDKIAIKCYVEEKDPEIILIERNIHFKQLEEYIQKSFGKCIILFKEEEYQCQIQNDNDLDSVLTLVYGDTLCLYLQPDNREIKDIPVDLLDEIPIPIIITNPFGTIYYINELSIQLLEYNKSEELLKKSIITIIPDIEEPKKILQKNYKKNIQFIKKNQNIGACILQINNTGYGWYVFSFIKS